MKPICGDYFTIGTNREHGHICTRRKGHKGKHIFTSLGVWGDEYRPDRIFQVTWRDGMHADRLGVSEE